MKTTSTKTPQFHRIDTPFERQFLRSISRSAQGAFLESLSLLVASGMDSASATLATAKAFRSGIAKKRLMGVWQILQAGYPLWHALVEQAMLPMQRIWLIRVGEETGQLAIHLETAVVQQRKEELFRGRVQSAMLYPVILLVIALVAGFGVAWFILPRLAAVFTTLQVELPLLTRWLLWVGQFLGMYGALVVPAAAFVLFLTFMLLFVMPGTKGSGQWLLLHTPGVSGLIRDGELGRFGSILGSLLKVGVPLPDALDALSNATNLYVYQRLYVRLSKQVTSGIGLEDAFRSIRGSSVLIPENIQQLVFSAERSGRLNETAKQIGENFEGRSEITAKNLTVILEPVLLFVVWIGVVLLAMSVITPIYSVLQGVNR
jgi:type II secretory pathway component PulF